jgi:hypothetical protein
MWSRTTCPKEWWSSLVGIKIFLYSMSQQPISCTSKLDFACIISHHCMYRTRPKNVTCVVLAGFQGGKCLAATTGLWSIKSTCKSRKLERGWNRIMRVTMWPATTVSTWRGFTGPQESLCIHRSRAFQLMNQGSDDEDPYDVITRTSVQPQRAPLENYIVSIWIQLCLHAA